MSYETVEAILLQLDEKYILWPAKWGVPGFINDEVIASEDFRFFDSLNEEQKPEARYYYYAPERRWYKEGSVPYNFFLTE